MAWARSPRCATTSPGRGSFIPLSPRKVLMNGNGAASLNGNTRRLLEVVQVNDAYRNVAETLLGEVVLVPDLSSGLALWRKNGVHVTMVTPDGDVIDATGVITGGSERPLEEEHRLAPPPGRRAHRRDHPRRAAPQPRPRGAAAPATPKWRRRKRRSRHSIATSTR